MHLEDCPHKMHAVCPPDLGHNIPVYEEGALISAVTVVICKNVAGNFRQVFSQKFVVGTFLQ